MYFLLYLLFDSFVVALQRLGENPDIITDPVHLWEQSARFGLETTIEYMRYFVLGMLHTDDACTVSPSP